MSVRRTGSAGEAANTEERKERRSRRQAPRRERELPTGDYAALVAIFNGVLASTLLARKCARQSLPERVEPQDLILFALSTQKLSRVITKDKVTAAFRAPAYCSAARGIKIASASWKFAHTPGMVVEPTP